MALELARHDDATAAVGGLAITEIIRLVHSSDATVIAHGGEVLGAYTLTTSLTYESGHRSH
ncbi:hypothetical protein [Agrococcus sp. Ld7]|uniref:hypothetical protein n=1 Tax=Agrococcus sp. Ld7 TaxID=649148 RepID=UPI003865F251